MNPPSFPDDPETRITALLLGELDPAEAAEVRAAMAADPELARLHDQLQATIAAVRQTLAPEASGAAMPEGHPNLPRLAEERRQQLLRKFQTVTPISPNLRASSRPTRAVPWSVSLARAAVWVALLSIPALLLPYYWLRTTKIKMSGLSAQLSTPARLSEERARADRSRVSPSGSRPSALSLGRTEESESYRRGEPASRVVASSSGTLVSPARVDTEPTARGFEGRGRDEALAFNQPLNVDPATGALVPLDIKLPIPAFMGTPTDWPLRKPAAPASAAQPDESRAAGIAGAAPPGGMQRERLPALRTSPSEIGREVGEPASVDSLKLESWGLAESLQRDDDRLDSIRRLAEAQSQPQSNALNGLVENEVRLGRTTDRSQPERDPFGLQPEVRALGDLVTPRAEAAGRVADAELGDLFARFESAVAARPAQPPLDPEPEVITASDPFSTFSLNVTDVSFRLAAASLERGQLPEPGSVRAEEFIHAFEYHDPEPAPGRRVGLTWERARYPFAHHRDLIRFSVKTAARGREPGRPLNLVLCLDSSGSMERADRVRIVREALTVLAGQLQPIDRVSVVAFARTARLWVDALPGHQADELLQRVSELVPEGGTNLEEALRLAYATAVRHDQPASNSRVILLTDGAANLGEVEPASLRQIVVAHRQQGIALDCFGVGWEGYHDDLLETLSRNGDGRYGFLNSPEEAATSFAAQLAGALQVAASDVKVQVQFNPRRVRHHRLIGYAKHRLTQEQFRDNTVDAAELGAAESGNALYVIEIDPAGTGPLGVVRVRFKVPGTERYEELEWVLPYEGPGRTLERASPALRLAATAGAFAEWLQNHPHAAEVNPQGLLQLLRGVPEVYPRDPRPAQLEWMIRQAGSIRGG